ncbi:hypothetical protein ACHAWF_004212 [Thalassiosira exigua]
MLHFASEFEKATRAAAALEGGTLDDPAQQSREDSELCGGGGGGGNANIGNVEGVRDDPVVVERWDDLVGRMSGKTITTHTKGGRQGRLLLSRRKQCQANQSTINHMHGRFAARHGSPRCISWSHSLCQR